MTDQTSRQRERPTETSQQLSENKLRTESNIWSQVPEWARYLDILTDWPTVSRKVTLTSTFIHQTAWIQIQAERLSNSTPPLCINMHTTQISERKTKAFLLRAVLQRDLCRHSWPAHVFVFGTPAGLPYPPQFVPKQLLMSIQTCLVIDSRTLRLPALVRVRSEALYV
jgi:hypothetical protein